MKFALCTAFVNLVAVSTITAADVPTVGLLTSSPASIQAGISARVTLSALVSGGVVPGGGVNLLQEDATGATLGVLGVMQDNGQNGDIAAGDGIYTIVVPFNVAQPGSLYLQAAAAFQGIVQRVKSPVLTLPVIGQTGSPTVTSFSPSSGPIGTLVTVNLAGFSPAQGVSPQVTLPRLSGGTIAAPVSLFSTAGLSFVVPAGAGSGNFNVAFGTQNATSRSTFSVSTSTAFTLSVGPSSARLFPGQTVAYSVSLGGLNGFDNLAALSIAGVPSGVEATFKPSAITAGQVSTLTLSAPASQSATTAALSVSASATIEGQTISRSANVNLQIVPITTTFLGRTVVDDTGQTPLAGVTVKFLGKDASGNSTGCSGRTVSDAGGNFQLADLPFNCTGLQLISYDGSTATSPEGKYAGVNLSYPLTAGDVTHSPVLVHLPRIDNAETVQIQQNAPNDQVFSFQSMPGLVVTVYKGTTFSLDDGSKPNPFPLVGVNVPIDRLPDKIPASGMVVPFIVAFQPANAVSSQPIGVNFPNLLHMGPGIQASLMTLDPTRGFMVPYGTGSVSDDGTQIVADPDPAHPGHQYGLIHFDWHGPVVRPANRINPCYDNYCPCVTHPVDIASGLALIRNTDISISGPLGTISIERVYRPGFVYGLNDRAGGPFGYGTNHNYSYFLDSSTPETASVINLILPEGNQFPYSKQSDGTFKSSGIPLLAGSVMSVPSAGHVDLRWKDGSVYHFSAHGSVLISELLDSISDSNGNTIQLTYDGLNLIQVTDPAGRWFKIHYAGGQGSVFGPIDVITDSTGRVLHYEYNASVGVLQGLPYGFSLLTTFTNANGERTSYGYDTGSLFPLAGSLLFITNARSVVFASYTYDNNGRVLKEKLADGSTTTFDYTLANQLVGTSPVIQTIVTDGLNHQTTYRFNTQAFLVGVTNALGQTRELDRDGANNVTAIHGSGACAVCGASAAGDQSFSYDSLGNLMSSTDALGNITKYTYDPIFNKVTSITDPLGKIESFIYDSTGNLKSVTDRKRHTTQFTYDGHGLLTQVKDPLNNVTSFGRDPRLNISSVTDPLNSFSTAVYDGVSRPIKITDALGRSTAISYDGVDRVLKRTDASNKSTAFVYDGVGNLLSVTDANGKTTEYDYNSMDQLQSKTDPLGSSDSRTYDFNGNLTDFKDRRGEVSHFGYDALDRLASETYDDGSSVLRNYDANGRLTSTTDSSSGAFQFTYDPAGKQLSSSTQFGAITYTYDEASRLKSRAVTGQPGVQYSFDDEGNLASAAMQQASVNLVYDADDRLSKITRSNAVVSDYAYDMASRLLSITHAGGAGVNISLAYFYDAAGNRTSQTTPLGQPLSSSATASTYNDANQLVSSQTASYLYDANGNLASSTDPNGNTTYRWDTRNRLTSISQPNGQSTTLLYDPWGNLLQQSDSGPVSSLFKQFTVDQFSNPVNISVSTGDNLSVLNGVDLDQDFAVVHPNNAVEYGLKDAINSTVSSMNQSGSSAGSLAYEPFGQVTGSGQYPFQFTGRTPISQSVSYFRAKFFNPSTGRFLSPDPLSVSINYVYGGNRPTSIIDPLGLRGVTLFTNVDATFATFEESLSSGTVRGGSSLGGGLYLHVGSDAWSSGVFSYAGPQQGANASTGLYGGLFYGDLSAFSGASATVSPPRIPVSLAFNANGFGASFCLLGRGVPGGFNFGVTNTRLRSFSELVSDVIRTAVKDLENAASYRNFQDPLLRLKFNY